jgi:hypothetical protein
MGDQMKRTLMVGLSMAALLAASLPWAAKAAGDGSARPGSDELIARCISQANRELRGTGRSIKRSQFDTIVVGSPGADDFSGYPPISPGHDLFCGFGGNDARDGRPSAVISPGDVFVGGGGDDFVYELDGGIVVGASGDDRIHELTRGLYVGGQGTDSAWIQDGGRFYGRAAHDYLDHLYGGRFIGGSGADAVTHQYGGTYLGGVGADEANQVDFGSTFIGGSGEDRVLVLGGSFQGGPDADLANDVLLGGRFVGGRGRDTAGRVSGAFYGSKGWDVVGDLHGRFNGGPGTDRLDFCMGGDAVTISVERGDLPCPSPKK